MHTHANRNRTIAAALTAVAMLAPLAIHADTYSWKASPVNQYWDTSAATGTGG